MIPHINSIVFLLILLLSCKGNKAIQNDTAIVKSENISNRKTVEVFTFYKAFPYCDSEIGYFTTEEAQKLYAEKEVIVDLQQTTKENKNLALSNEKLNCLEKNLNIEINNEILKINKKDNFPFDSFLLINDKFIVVARDAYFFVFEKKELANSGNINKILFQDDSFKKILNKNIIGLSVIDEKEQSVYKKYGIDFSANCNCDSPAMYINTEQKEVIIFNYCDTGDRLKEIKYRHIYKISRISGNNQLIITTDNNLVITFSKIDNLPLFEMMVEGHFPTEYTGNNIKKIYTTEPQKFVKEDCGDYDG